MIRRSKPVESKESGAFCRRLPCLSQEENIKHVEKKACGEEVIEKIAGSSRVLGPERDICERDACRSKHLRPCASVGKSLRVRPVEIEEYEQDTHDVIDDVCGLSATHICPGVAIAQMPDEAENERRNEGNVIMGADIGNFLAGSAKADQQPNVGDVG